MRNCCCGGYDCHYLITLYYAVSISAKRTQQKKGHTYGHILKQLKNKYFKNHIVKYKLYIQVQNIE